MKPLISCPMGATNEGPKRKYQKRTQNWWQNTTEDARPKDPDLVETSTEANLSCKQKDLAPFASLVVFVTNSL